RMGEAIKKIDGVGGIAQLSAFWDMPGGETDRTKVDLKRLLPGGDQNAELNGWLDAIVETGKHAVRDDGTKIPFIFRPLHEANGEWAWWYYERGGAETYKELFRYVVNYLKEHGLDGQFLTAFAPNGNFNGDESRYKLLYPGDDVVDVLSMDSYDTNNALLAKDKWAGELVEDMAMLARMAEARGKLAAVAEFGREGDKVIHPDGNKDLTWYTDVLEAIKANPDAAKVAYMMTWANFGGSPVFSAFTPWPGHEMADNFREFVKQMTMTRNAERDISVDVTIEHGSTDDGDVKTTTQRVTIPKGQNSATFTVDAIADGKQEGDEHYTVRISKAQGGQIEAGKDSVTTTIHDEGSAPPANHAGTVTISGEAKEDTSLTATVADEDGVPNGVHYQWLRDGKPIDGAHQKTYVLRGDDVGHKISVRATYQDNAAHDEAPTSSETDAVVAKQAQPQQNHAGTVSINGTLKVGETLTAAVADEDGVPKDVQYQWLRDGQPISGGTGERYQLTADDAGHKISVQAFYQDKAQHNESPVSAQSEVPKDATPPTGNFHDDFSAYPAGSEYPQGTTFGQWNVVQSGYGHVKIVDNGGGNNALELKPKAQSGQTATSSTEVIGPQHGDEFTFSGTISTPEQLRQGATPNAWETGWLVWNYTDNDHFYYFVPRANGWELGKRDPAYAGGQRFLATGSEGWPLADSKQFTISKQGGTIEVKINGKVIATVTDDDQPYNGNGRIGIYSEDARVLADDIDLSGKATIEGTANHLGHITLKPNGNTFTAEVHDEDGIAAGTITYQWYSAGQPIAGATGQSYTLKDGDKEVTVRANYTDNSGRGESVLSPVAAGDNHPGSVALDGEAKVGATLTANVNDADGVPDRVQYTWLRDGTLISGAEGKTYTLQAADIGHKITVQAYYKDHAGHEENHVISAPTAPVTDGTTPPVANLTANLTGASAVSEGSTAHYRVELDLSPVGKTTGAAALLQQLKDLAAHKQILFGQQHAIDESARGDSANDGYGRKSDVAAMSGKYPAVFGFDSDEEPAEHGKTPEENGKALAKAFIEADSLGATVTLSSHLKNPVTGGSAFDTSKVEAQRLISGDLQSKLHDWLDTVATAANNAVRADGSKVPVIFRPLHENTGDWFWWGKGHMSADDYKALWQHIHKYLEDKGVDNLLYAYSPNGSLGGDKAKYLEAYPGDNYVDIFGYDAYQSEPQARQSDAAWRSQTVRDLEMVTKLAGEHGKVAAFTEFGLNNDRVIQPAGNENTQFFSELLGAIKGSDAASQLAYMMTWANWGVDENGKFQSYTPWPGHEMEGDFKKFLDGLTLAKMPEKDVTVDIALQHGTTDDSDAKLSTERVTIAKGQSGADFTVEALADGKKEGDETYTVKITHADGANIGKENLATTIHDGSANSAPLEHHEPQLQHDDGAAAGADNAAHDANHAIAHAQDDNSTASLHIGDGIDPATYAKLVSLDNAELLQYLGEHSRELLAATQHQGAHEQHGGSGDDTLVATHGTTLQEGGAAADTFAYLLDGGDTLHWQGASTITDYNPGEGDRIVLKHGAGWQVESVDFDPATQNLTIKATHGAQTYSNTVHLHAHDGHYFNTEEILNAVTIL
ncbi:glycosyl hydrolase, partial [Cardiobacterium hominis]